MQILLLVEDLSRIGYDGLVEHEIPGLGFCFNFRLLEVEKTRPGTQLKLSPSNDELCQLVNIFSGGKLS